MRYENRENKKINLYVDVTIQTKIYIFVYNLRFRELRLCTRRVSEKRETYITYGHNTRLWNEHDEWKSQAVVPKP